MVIDGFRLATFSWIGDANDSDGNYKPYDASSNNYKRANRSGAPKRIGKLTSIRTSKESNQDC